MNQPRMPSPAILVAVLALVAALAGTAIAGPDADTSAITKKKVKKIVKKQINKLAPGLSVAFAEEAGNANTANSASTANDADKLGGVPGSGYVRHSELAPVPVTNLTLNTGWINPGAGPGTGPGPARAYRDQLGVVHLAGLIIRASGTENVALTLPPSFRPGFRRDLPAVCDVEGDMFDPRPGVVGIDADGDVRPVSPTGVSCTERLSLDGISFRAGG